MVTTSFSLLWPKPFESLYPPHLTLSLTANTVASTFKIPPVTVRALLAISDVTPAGHHRHLSPGPPGGSLTHPGPTSSSLRQPGQPIQTLRSQDVSIHILHLHCPLRSHPGLLALFLASGCLAPSPHLPPTWLPQVTPPIEPGETL